MLLGSNPFTSEKEHHTHTHWTGERECFAFRLGLCRYEGTRFLRRTEPKLCGPRVLNIVTVLTELTGLLP